MTHVIEVRGRTQRYGWQTIKFGCPDCDLHGHLRTAPARVADQLLAMLRADHQMREAQRAGGHG